MPSTKNIEFQTRDDLILRGPLTLMEKPNAPLGILLSPSGVISAHLMNVQAKVFNDAGFATLTYDPRTFGQSDGLPRHNINFDKQSEDVFDAVTYVTSLAPQIDITRIALFGGGHGGDKQQYVQLFPSPSEEAAANPQKALLGGPALFGFYSSIQMLAYGKNCNWENKVTLESAYYNFINEFQAYLPRVSPTPLLCVRPSGDIP
ncbi:uncharacterized protein TrAFT101_002350 [Trichoderma asperellum]|uniref:uncharacterized protein n=1 Tax=Trichoderma asperellum TaxID=101201 RepID=UPI003331F6C2|nr:hypothetical protein TrAFT101_002350 [Trichoderma asperellum]